MRKTVVQQFRGPQQLTKGPPPRNTRFCEVPGRLAPYHAQLLTESATGSAQACRLP